MSYKTRRAYSENEEKFFRDCVRLGDKYGISNSELGRFLSPVLSRTNRGIEQKLSATRKEMRLEQENSNLDVAMTRPRRNAKPTIEYANLRNREQERFFVDAFTDDDIQVIQEFRDDPNNTNKRKYFSVDDIGKVVKVRVGDIKPYGAFCRDEEGTTGLLVKSYISDDYVHNIGDYLKPGDEFYAKIIRDNERSDRTLLNAKEVGNIIPIKDRV